MQSDSPVYSAPSTQPESALKPQDVQLEANAGAGAVQFRGFAGALKAHLQWLPLQWTYIAKGALYSFYMFHQIEMFCHCSTNALLFTQRKGLNPGKREAYHIK